jgi:hypothetical protein
MELELTKEEVDLLQNILVCLSDKLDWIENDDNNLIKAKVLLEKDESIPRMVKNIYDKLF